MRPPTCTSIGFGTPVPRPYFGAELGSSNSFADLFNVRSPLRRATSGCNGFARSASKIRQMQASRAAELTYGGVTDNLRLILFKRNRFVSRPYGRSRHSRVGC